MDDSVYEPSDLRPCYWNHDKLSIPKIVQFNNSQKINNYLFTKLQSQFESNNNYEVCVLSVFYVVIYYYGCIFYSRSVLGSVNKT